MALRQTIQNPVALSVLGVKDVGRHQLTEQYWRVPPGPRYLRAWLTRVFASDKWPGSGGAIWLRLENEKETGKVLVAPRIGVRYAGQRWSGRTLRFAFAPAR